MASYAARLLGLRGKRDDLELTWELAAALDEKRSGTERLTPSEEVAWHACKVVVCQGIGELLTSSRESVQAAADFARRRGLAKTAEILSNAARDVPVPGGVRIGLPLFGRQIRVPLPSGRWGATDLALVALDERLESAILDFVAENESDFSVPVPAAMARKDALASRVGALAASRTPLELLQELLAHRNPRIRAQIREDERTGTASDWLEVPVTHRATGPADAKRLARLRDRYGPSAEPLLAVYAEHDGAQLFIAQRRPGFVLVPTQQWPEHMGDVMAWAREVTWSDEPEKIPDYLESSIPFGHIPGDSQRWLFITRGEHAGKVMLSDADVIDDQPRFESIGEVFAAMILDVRRVLGSGGHVSYGPGVFQSKYYPEEYVA